MLSTVGRQERAPYIWSRDRTTVISDKSGKTLKLYGVIEDIEDRKTLHLALEKS